jgi:hypothetical protein
LLTFDFDFFSTLTIAAAAAAATATTTTTTTQQQQHHHHHYHYHYYHHHHITTTTTSPPPPPPPSSPCRLVSAAVVPTRQNAGFSTADAASVATRAIALSFVGRSRSNNSSSSKQCRNLAA